MQFQPEKITREHVIQALDNILKTGVSLKPSTKFDVIIDGKAYPPKEIMRYAHAAMNGDKIWRLRGGKPTNDYLKKFGFEVVKKHIDLDPVALMIEKYKKHIRATQFHEERYKWRLINEMKGKPNLNAPDFLAELKSIEYKNLVYPMAIAVLLHIARERAEQLRECFRKLFDETQDLTVRIKTFSDETLKIYREIKGTLNHHQDERSMATYLTFFNPDRYMIFKTTFYELYCELIKVEKKKPKEKYTHYLELLDDFIDDYVSCDEELIGLKDQYLPKGQFEDKDHRLLAQDILYQMLERTDREARKTEKRYWRIGTSDKDGNYWHRMKANSYASIGWADLGDLTAEKLEKKEIVEMMTDIGYYNGSKSTISRKAGEIYNFLKTIKPGDIMLAQDGEKVLGIGEVSDEDIGYDANEVFPTFRPIEWVITEPNNFFSSDGNQTTVYEISDKETISKVNQLLNSELPTTENTNQRTMDQYVKNLILYGPPGTGKTYNSIDKAVFIATGKSADHNVNKLAFDRLRKEGQIEFVTFHQNYTYEDFMVGIKPELSGASQLQFRKWEGIFYKICKRAEQNYLSNKEPFETLKPFEQVIALFLKPLQENAEEIEIKMASNKTSFWITDINPSNLGFRKQSGGTEHTLSLDTIKELYEGTRQFTSGLRYYYVPLLEKLWAIGKNARSKVDLLNFVLVIDEINRANISKVFGELITLLEDDKRLGQDNELRISLPNGEKDFGIPPNLFVIGTMNTADKSIALIDIALRRRFEFKGYYPIYEGYDSDAAHLLEKLNENIYTLKKSSDYLIGHAYFMNGKGIEPTLRNKVIPLLMEYFSGKVNLVNEVFKGTDWSVSYNAKTYSWDILPNA